VRHTQGGYDVLIAPIVNWPPWLSPSVAMFANANRLMQTLGEPVLP